MSRNVAPSSEWSERSRQLAQLLARTGLADRQAFAELYQRTSGHLFAVVLRIQRDRAVAELCGEVRDGGGVTSGHRDTVAGF